MKRLSNVYAVFLCFLFTISLLPSFLFGNDGAGRPSKSEIIQKTKKLQIPFIANNGQMDEQVRFYASTFGGTVFVTKDGEIVYALPAESEKLKVEREKRGVGCVSNCAKQGPDRSIPRSEIVRLSAHDEVRNPKSELKGLVLKEELVGGKISNIKGEGASVTKVNYFREKIRQSGKPIYRPMIW
jgi:hypothetical protein